MIDVFRLFTIEENVRTRVTKGKISFLFLLNLSNKFSELSKFVVEFFDVFFHSFAKEINVAFSTVNRWESGKTKPNLTAMKSIKEFCSRNDVDYASLEELWLDLGSEGKQHG